MARISLESWPHYGVNYYPKKENGYSNYSYDSNNFFPSKSDIDSLPIHVLIIIHHQTITAATIKTNIRASLVFFVKSFTYFSSTINPPKKMYAHFNRYCPQRPNTIATIIISSNIPIQMGYTPISIPPSFIFYHLLFVMYLGLFTFFPFMPKR